MQKQVRRVGLPASVTEEWLTDVVRRGVSPTLFADFVLDGIDLDQWLHAYTAERGDAAGTDPRLIAIPPSRARPVHGSPRQWTKEAFSSYLDALRKPGNEHLLCLLAAYSDVGPAPTSRQLQERCGFDDSVLGRVSWYQELRAAKARLTIAARKFGFSPFFEEPRITSRGRTHPLSTTAYEWLLGWVSQRQGELPPPERWGRTILQSDKYAELSSSNEQNE